MSNVKKIIPKNNRRKFFLIKSNEEKGKKEIAIYFGNLQRTIQLTTRSKGWYPSSIPGDRTICGKTLLISRPNTD